MLFIVDSDPGCCMNILMISLVRCVCLFIYKKIYLKEHAYMSGGRAEGEESENPKQTLH